MKNNKTVVMFNHWFSAIYNTIKSIKESERGEQIMLVGSSKNKNTVYKSIVDKFYTEPEDDISDSEYVTWLLNTCIKECVDVLFIKRGMAAVAKSIHLFHAKGIKVICDRYNNIMLLDNKEDTYRSVIDSGYTPAYTVVDNYKDFKESIIEYISLYGRAVVKNICDEGSRSVRIVYCGASSDTYKNGFTGMNMSVEDMLTSYKLEELRGKAPKVMIMEYLTDEVSVDCYIHGDDEYALCRFKDSKRIQRIEHRDTLESVALTIGKSLNLKYPYNVQFRKDSNNCYRVLEVNTRMSGGIHMASLSGVNIPLICLYDAMGWSYEKPEFKEVTVTQVETPLIVS